MLSNNSISGAVDNISHLQTTSEALSAIYASSYARFMNLG